MSEGLAVGGDRPTMPRKSDGRLAAGREWAAPWERNDNDGNTDGEGGRRVVRGGLWRDVGGHCGDGGGRVPRQGTVSYLRGLPQRKAGCHRAQSQGRVRSQVGGA